MSKKNSKIKHRLREYTVFKGYSQRKFNKKIEASDSFLKSDGGFNVDFLPVIRQNCPDLNMDWLIYGEGKMILTPVTKTFVEEEPIVIKNQKIKDELSLIGLNTRIDNLSTDFNLLKSEMYQIVRDELEEAFKNREF